MGQIAIWCVAGIIALIATLSALRYDVPAWLKSLWSPAQPEVELTVSPKQQDVRSTQSDENQAARTIQSAKSNEPETSGPKFDVVRIDPQGASVFAGRAPANSNVTVLANQTAVASAKADENGQWAAVIERKFDAGDYQLQLSSKAGQPADGQSVQVTIAGSAAGSVKAQPPIGSKSVPPRPITFVYDEASFTPDGQRAAQALSDYLRSKQLKTVKLTGHADERGSQAYNMELSRQRLQAVERYLRDRGYTGELVLVPKGKSEPFPFADRSALPKDDIFQLDRRVQLHLTE
ncbi:MAG: OmpA family protein [Bacteroidota bacterium]